jgi:hypothetical protein
VVALSAANLNALPHEGGWATQFLADTNLAVDIGLGGERSIRVPLTIVTSGSQVLGAPCRARHRRAIRICAPWQIVNTRTQAALVTRASGARVNRAIHYAFLS